MRINSKILSPEVTLSVPFLPLTIMNPKIVSYNCHGLKSSIHDIIDICSKHDVVFLQETWLYNDELHLLSSIHPDFESYGVSAINVEKGIVSGRPYGGLAILWRKSITHLVNICDYKDPRLLGIVLTCPGDKLHLINAYLPYQNVANHDMYIEYLGKLAAIISEIDTS